ncbi:transposase [Neochlamydia sp. TUME1]
MYRISDENVVYRWVENAYWQYFCGHGFWHQAHPFYFFN